MKIDEWKAKFLQLHKEMKEDLGAEMIDVYIDDDITHRAECWPALSVAITNVKIIAK